MVLLKPKRTRKKKNESESTTDNTVTVTDTDDDDEIDDLEIDEDGAVFEGIGTVEISSSDLYKMQNTLFGSATHSESLESGSSEGRTARINSVLNKLESRKAKRGEHLARPTGLKNYQLYQSSDSAEAIYNMYSSTDHYMEKPLKKNIKYS